MDDGDTKRPTRAFVVTSSLLAIYFGSGAQIDSLNLFGAQAVKFRDVDFIVTLGFLAAGYFLFRCWQANNVGLSEYERTVSKALIFANYAAYETEVVKALSDQFHWGSVATDRVAEFVLTALYHDTSHPTNTDNYKLRNIGSRVVRFGMLGRTAEVNFEVDSYDFSVEIEGTLQTFLTTTVRLPHFLSRIFPYLYAVFLFVFTITWVGLRGDTELPESIAGNVLIPETVSLPISDSAPPIDGVITPIPDSCSNPIPDTTSTPKSDSASPADDVAAPVPDSGSTTNPGDDSTPGEIEGG